MLQLKFNEDFSEIVMDIPHWKVQEDIPDNIIQFIKDTSDNRVIYEESTGNFYCAKCAKQLDENNFCPNCNIQHKKYTSDIIELNHNKDVTIVDKVTTTKKYLLNTICNYFIFDIVGQNVMLYYIEEKVSYDNPFYASPYKSSKLHINNYKSYFIEKNGVTNLETNAYTSFQDLDNCNKELDENWDNFFEKVESSDIYKIYEEFVLLENSTYLYTDNLNDLRKTIYKYSKIWECSDYLKEQPSFNISELTMHPLYYPQFEYLVNYKLYNLALHVPAYFRKGKNFKEIFGIDKKYLPFMVQKNIDFREFRILQVYPTTDIEILEFFTEFNIEHIHELVKEHKIDLKTLKDYILGQNLSKSHFYDYLDYINMAKELRLDLQDKKVLYPANLREAHDELYNQIEIMEEPVIDAKVKSIAQLLSFNKYEDDTYVIYPASSIADLVEESRQQKNCVRTYCERIANNECQIYFMRKKENINKSFVTIEVYNNKIVQARVKYNELPSEEINEILEKWETTLTPFIID